MEQKKIAKMLYERKIAINKPIDNPEGESLALAEMFRHFQNIGYDYHYIEDIELRKNNDVKIMRILHDFLPYMESIYTKQIFIRKIDPGKFPDILDYAIDEFIGFSPSEKRCFTGFDEVISKGRKDNNYYVRVSELLKNGDSYAALSDTREMLCKNCPDLIFPYTQKYCRGVLLPSAFQDMIFDSSEETKNFLNQCCSITEDELNLLIGSYDYKSNKYFYELSVTGFEYWRRLCSVECIRKMAANTLKKRSKQMNFL